MSSINRNRLRVLTHTSTSRTGPGPLRNLMDRLGLLESKVYSLESQLRLVTKKLKIYESNGHGGRNDNETSINHIVSRQLKEQTFEIQMKLVPVNDVVQITKVSAGTSTALLGSPSRSQRQTTPASSSKVLVKPDPDDLVILEEEFEDEHEAFEIDNENDMEFLENDQDQDDYIEELEEDSSSSKDPDWSIGTNCSKNPSGVDTRSVGRTRKRRKSENGDKNIDKVKPKKAAPLSFYERELLTDLVNSHIEIIDNKTSDFDSIDKKRKAWESIARSFNSKFAQEGVPEKEWDQLRKYWYNSKQKSKNSDKPNP